MPIAITDWHVELVEGSGVIMYAAFAEARASAERLAGSMA